MHISVRTKGLELTNSLREYTVRRLQFALGWARTHLERVSVRLTDENGPRGGFDKRCRIQLRLNGRPTVLVDDLRDDLYVAIDEAVERAAQSLARRIKRQQKKGRANLRSDGWLDALAA